jgi:hypothetical protein
MLEPKPRGESLRFCLCPSDRGTYVLVTVDVAKVDLAWQPIREHYIGLDGSGAKIERLEGFSRWLNKNPAKPIWASTLYLSDERNWVHFHDGRHRFAVLRDLGYRTVRVAVPRRQAAQFREHFAPEAVEPPLRRKSSRVSR